MGSGPAAARAGRPPPPLTLRAPQEIHERTRHLDDAELATLPDSVSEAAADDLIAQIIRRHSIKYNGIKHQEAMELVLLFYRKA